MTDKVNLDLERERASASFSSEDFAIWWAGGPQALQERRAIEKLFFDDPDFDYDTPISYLSYKELYEHVIAKSTKFIAKLRQLQRERGTEATIQSLADYRQKLAGPLGSGLFQQSFPFRLHFSMFLPTLLNQGTEEQKRLWLERAFHFDGIVGSYAQTELGHGSYIRGLETRADYDAEREEFILSTPTLSAYKWWPGGLGHTANMVVVMAQLYIAGKHYGLQPFLVRIRNEETHMPEPGVDVGDIGAKLGAAGVNNGFLGLHNVRIPRTQMLMKNAQVLPDGTFVRGPEPLLLYATMVYVRVSIVRDVMFGLLQAATIATRYSAVRHQSPIEPGQPEPQILDHVTQQAKVLPQIAKGICYRLAADYVWQLYQQVSSELDAGNRRNLPEMHALSCCLKAICTQDACTGIDTLRKACGGQGYLASANFSAIFGLATAAYTYEGEYTVLQLQTARFLLKQYVDSLKRKLLPRSVTYLRDTSRLQWVSGHGLLATTVRAFETTAYELVRRAWESKRLKLKKLGVSEAQANNLTGIKLCAAAAAHARAFLARNAHNHLAQLKRDLKPNLYAVLEQLIQLFIYDMFLSNLDQILLCNAINATQVAQVEQRFEQLLAALRKEAVAIVDGFDFHDRVLGSTLGCYDGRVYERLMEDARKNPLNQQPVNQSFHAHLKPLMKGKL